MTAAFLWALAGFVLLAIASASIVKLEAAALGPHATRLVALLVALAAYFGALSLTRHIPALANPVRLRLVAWVVPLAGGAGVLYCAWRILQNWHAELHGLVRGALKLLLIVALAVLARLCFTL
jgi:hypothetical protein